MMPHAGQEFKSYRTSREYSHVPDLVEVESVRIGSDDVPDSHVVAVALGQRVQVFARLRRQLIRGLLEKVHDVLEASALDVIESKESRVLYHDCLQLFNVSCCHCAFSSPRNVDELVWRLDPVAVEISDGRRYTRII